ncbi:hypothetical protein L198_04850 [Cryptococcus wingfieldii CBS 7118]|uniref:Uncharacterized protein n=1 Tax=Cryptococcus wingfieldii CBS 7118 TaxID=1295528 RepID=A0A1E3J1I2_9TREE|nr:hypothetical protein L198_04850 [Cryptococcus wingfieldii CBS 7118]ODN94709.1 hypothetical protein L198_04850 [Cryptococcus wingfieldii CBS 7118]
MSEPLSRIAVDHESDWIRVQKNVAQAITDSMEARLATMPGGKDGEAARVMRIELEERLGKIQERMWHMAKYNIQVNGQNYEDYVQATEGFDEVLDRKIWGLNTERVEHETRIAERRKRMPDAINQMEEDLEGRREEAEWLPDEQEEETDASNAQEIPKPERYEEVRETFEIAAANLAEVARSAPIQLQRAQRAQTVQEEITNMPP